MDAQLLVYVTLVSTSGVLNLFLCLYSFFRRRQYPTLSSLLILHTAATAIYCFGYAFSLTSTTIEQLRLWNIVQYAGMPLAPPLGLLFVLQYLGIKVNKKWVAILLAIPILTFLLDLTNDYHGLLYRIYEIDPLMGAPYVYKEYGAWFVVHGIFLFSCMLTASILLISRWKETANNYRPQLAVLLCGQMLPMITSFLYLIGVTPAGVDPVPMVVWASSIMFLWSIHTSRILSILPVAKETIFNNINDGVMVLDDSLRLVEYNFACKEMLPALRPSMYGQHIEAIWHKLVPVATELPVVNVTKELQIMSGDAQPLIYQMRVTSFKQANYRSGSIIILTNITELKLLQQQLEHQAYYDELTGIYNRRAFFKEAENMLRVCSSEQLAFTIIMLDVDHFKSINDTYGHLFGDQMLQHIASTCKAQLLDHMLLARYGGEEMVIALPSCSLEQGEQFAELLRKQIEQSPLSYHHNSVPVTSSFGVATTYVPLEQFENYSQSLSLVLQAADEALYEAKRGGRNQVVCKPST